MKEAEPHWKVLSDLLQALRRRLGDRLVSLVVYGSVARGEARRDSDIDVLIVAEGLPNGRMRRSRIFEEVEEEVSESVKEAWARGYSVDFSPILKTPEEAAKLSPLYLDMVEDAVILYDEGGFFGKVLARLRERLRQLGAKRLRVGNKWYWILKDGYEAGEVISIE
ncbi:MAG: nucleotidyltransferase domain-containing protein [Candidatus Brockarchaeota archaeon]|nr:nucleotidyltransferase domain-containing protein [Candidatus Brockarchaeota archaeon]